jgi:D-glycero-alpha-D-manno-heptose 1-phosphate guanylyltransferase
MAQIGVRPFLELLLRQLRRNSFRRVVLAVGYRKEVISSHFGNEFSGLELLYSEESSPLGTGGALRNAASLVKSETVLILNGDSYTDTNLYDFVEHHHVSNADGSVLVVRTDGRSDCGSVLLDDDGWIRSFQEKVSPGASAYVNAGIYALSKALLNEIPDGVQVSIELQLFPKWLSENKRLRGVVSSAECVDIGTPERYRMAQQVLVTAESNGRIALKEHLFPSVSEGTGSKYGS